MQKQMSYKKIIIYICAAAAVAVIAVIVLLSNREETFRSILVYDVEGTAVIERESVGSMNAAENLYLESGDRVSVAQDSGMRMKLDDDKYVMAEADTIFSVEAEGTDENSRTRICLEQGAITNEIRHPLSEGSQYETSTPNSVMAVRGTIYRVELCVDDNGNQNTKLCCFQGKVETTPIHQDGTYGEAVLVPAGSELTVYSDGTTDDIRDITYEELSGQALQNLRGLLENGQSMEGITLPELDELIGQSADVDGGQSAGRSEESETSESEQTVQSAMEEGSGKRGVNADADIKTAGKVSAKAGNAVENPVTPQAPAGQLGQAPQIPNVTQPMVSKPAGIENTGSDNAGGDASQDENTDDDSDNNDQDEDKPDNGRPDKDKSDKDKSETYKVTFMYGDSAFATQEVKSGETVSVPVLAPAESGDWDFDFGTRIKADTTVKWK